jgi:excinuclease ABC subunit C
MIDSTLDDVPGIGPTRKKALLRRFGSLKGIRAASRAELSEALPEAVAIQLYTGLHGSDR